MRIARWCALVVLCLVFVAMNTSAEPRWWLSAGVFRTDSSAQGRALALVQAGISGGRIIATTHQEAARRRVIVGPFPSRELAAQALPSLRRVVADAWALPLDVVDTTATAPAAESSAQSSSGSAALPAAMPAPMPAAALASADSANEAALKLTAARPHDAPSAAAGPATAPPGEALRGASLREYLRRNGGDVPVSPAQAPVGYQLNRLHRSADGAATNTAPGHAAPRNSASSHVAPRDVSPAEAPPDAPATSASPAAPRRPAAPAPAAGDSAAPKAKPLATGQRELPPLAPLYVAGAAAPIEIDGRLDEPIWQQAAVQDRFVVLDPDTLADPRHRTQARLLYTDRGLYVGFLNDEPSNFLISRLSSRDQLEINRDQVQITVDTSGQARYGYFFNIALGDSVADGTVLPERQFRNEWDGPWRGATAKTTSGWSAEMFIPWTMMSMPDVQGQRRMGMYVSRRVAYIDERWGWPEVPQTKARFLSALQPMVFDNVHPGKQITFYPFVSQTTDGVDHEIKYKTGADIYWRPSTNLQLSTTLNPDFGQVEADDVVVNLTAVETFFPEKRPFFLEGNEIFVTGPRAEVNRRGRGGEPTTLVNTRRIGDHPRAPTIPLGVTVEARELNQHSDLLGATKVTGQLGGVRYGVLAAFEDDTNIRGQLTDGSTVNLQQSGRNFAVARALYEDTDDGAYQAIGWLATLVAHPQQDARVNALDYHTLSRKGEWKSDAQFMFSQVSGLRDGYGAYIDIENRPRRGLSHKFSFDYLDKNLRIDDFGFVRRTDAISFKYQYDATENNVDGARSRNTNIFLNQEYAESDHRLVRSGMFLRRFWTLNSSARVRVEYDFFPRRWEDRNSFGNGDYRVSARHNAELEFNSASTSRIGYTLFGGLRQEDLGGNSYVMGGAITIRPTDAMSIDLKLDHVDHHGWLIYRSGRNFTTYDAQEWQPKVDVNYFLNAKQQLRVALQWVAIRADDQKFLAVPLNDGNLAPRAAAARGENFNISAFTWQLRYRWEIAPLSDVFVVYTKNGNQVTRTGGLREIFDESFSSPVGESLILKLRYRLGS